MSIMITGSAGFIGCYTMRDALSQNEKVVSFDFTPDLSIIQDVLGDQVNKITRPGGFPDLPLMLQTAKANKVDKSCTWLRFRFQPPLLTPIWL